MDDEFDQWQQAEEVPSQNLTPAQNQNEHIQFLQAQTIQNQHQQFNNTIKNIQEQNIIEKQNLAFSEPQNKQADEWIFGDNQNSQPLQQKKEEQKIIKPIENTNNYLSFDSRNLEYPIEPKNQFIYQELKSPQCSIDSQLANGLQFNPQLQNSQEQKRVVMSTSTTFNIDFHIGTASSELNLPFIHNNQVSIQSKQSSNLYSDILANQPTPLQQNSRFITYKLSDPTQQQQWEWQKPTIKHQNQQNKTNNEIIDIKQKITDNAHIQNNNQSLNNGISQSQNTKKVLNSQANKLNSQEQEDDQFAWVQQPNQTQSSATKQNIGNATQNISRQPYQPVTQQQSQFKSNVEEQIHRQDDEFGDFQGQNQQNQVTSVNSASIEPQISPQDYEKVMNFLNRLPDYSFIQASSFITI